MPNCFRCFARVIAVSACSVLPLTASAQQPRPQRPPDPPKNLQILPKDISREDLMAAMQSFTQGLGVRCSYCHADEVAGQDADMASDEKPAKATARAMMRLSTETNAKLATLATKPATALTRVQCVTCHRGVAIPKQLPEIVAATTAEKGLPAAVAQYRDLRKQYYGAQAYDFSEAGLLPFAQRLTQGSKADEALSWLQLNLEFYPASARTFLAIGQAYDRKGDQDAAIKNVQQALTIDPNNAAAKRALDQLKK